MPETSQTLERKRSELASELAATEQELARADRTRSTEAHARLSALVRQASAWLEARGADEADPAAAARKAEELLHDIRMGRAEL